MATSTNHPDIGAYRKIRLNHQPNKGGYWEIWWADAGRGFITTKHSTKTKDRNEAAAYLAAFCADRRAEAAAIAGARDPTVEELCRRWLVYAEAEGKALVNGYALAAVRRELGSYTPAQLDGAVLQDYVVQRHRSDGTIRRELTQLRAVLNWAVDPMRLLTRDDMPSFKGVIPASGPPRVKFLDAAQEQHFWDEAMRWGEPSRWRHSQDRTAARRVMLFVALGLETAARREAILDLAWDRVDLGQGTIDFIVPGKRFTKKRRVKGMGISDRLMPVLKEAWLAAPKDGAGRAVGPVIGVRYIGDPFARFAHAAGLPWVTPHVLRHTWASLAAMAGVSLYDISEFMGDTVATVNATYLHLAPGHLKTVANYRAKSPDGPARTPSPQAQTAAAG